MVVAVHPSGIVSFAPQWDSPEQYDTVSHGSEAGFVATAIDKKKDKLKN